MASAPDALGSNIAHRAGTLVQARPLSTAGVVGIFIVAAMILIAVLAPVLPLPAPDKIDAAHRLLPPLSPMHPLGTDQFGRDILSRFVWGARVSLTVGVACTLAALLLGL